MYAFSSPPTKLSVFETADNASGLCCLGSKVVAFPGPTPGQVKLVEIETGNVSIIPAHGSPLKAMELSPDGEVLATASETVGFFSCSGSRQSWSNTRGLGNTDPRLLDRKLHPDRRASSRY